MSTDLINETTEGIVLKDRNGNDVAYYGIETVTFDTTTEGKQQTYTKGVAVEGVEVELDFTGGDQVMAAPDGGLVKQATIKKPEDLVPENIAAGKSVAGVLGTFEGNLIDDVEVVPDFSEGDQTFTAPDGYGVKSGVIKKPETLKPENIASGVEVAGVTGVFAGNLLEGVEVTPDFSEGDQTFTAPDGYGVKSGVIKKPETLAPENIKKGATVAGVAGAFEGNFIGDIAVELDLSDGDQTIQAPEGYGVTSATIKKPETLVPENIADGVEVAGVVGTLASGGGYAPSRAINFYDIYGNIVYSYTRAQAAALTELPAVPQIDGFEVKGWNRTLAEVQGAVAFMDVGPRYTKNGNDIALLLLDLFANDSVKLQFYSNGSGGTVSIDWGDGNTESQTISSGWTTYTKTHTYTTKGRFFISLTKPTNDLYLGKYNASSSGYSTDGNVIVVTRKEKALTYDNCLLSCSGFAKCSTNVVSYKHSLRYAEIPISSAYTVAVCYSLIVNTAKNENTSLYKGNYASCHSIRRGTGRLYGGTHYTNTGVAISDHIMTSGSGVVFNGSPIKRIVITGTTVGTMTGINTDVLEGIYVPDTAVDTFKAHSSWSAYADYIKPLSEYPDY